MKLTAIRVKDFRSFAGSHEFDVVSGVNYFVGPNNCGKSNLIRAVELALDPDTEYEPSKDRPARAQSAGAPAKTRITLTFQIGKSEPEKTLTKYAEAYELQVRRGRPGSYAANGELHMVTTFEAGGARRTTFAARGIGATSLPLDSDEHKNLERQFRKLVRFGVIHSGEDLESLLKGKFLQILQLVIRDHLSDEMERAEHSRHAYVDSLQKELLEPLRQKVLDRVQGLFPEITSANLIPAVSTLDQTLSSVAIQLGDLATTDLAEKGTGVRGAVLVSMLQYMAEQSRRSLVVALEEPEAFLHPGGQEQIRGQLEELAKRSDVSLLVTTHSPYVVSRSAEALITELRKDADGVSRRAASARGHEDRAELLGSLYRDAGLSRVLERAQRIPVGTRVIVVTEGYTDGLFVTQCCRAAGRSDLLEGVHFAPAGGAAKLVMHVILAHSSTDLPVLALLDHDDSGRAAIEKLESMNWSKKRGIIALRSWSGACTNHDIEIEDLLPATAVRALSSKLGDENALDGTQRCRNGWHYRTSKPWKEAAVSQLEGLLPNDDPGGMIWLAEEINARAALISGSKQH